MHFILFQGHRAERAYRYINKTQMDGLRNKGLVFAQILASPYCFYTTVRFLRYRYKKQQQIMQRPVYALRQARSLDQLSFATRSCLIGPHE